MGDRRKSLPASSMRALLVGWFASSPVATPSYQTLGACGKGRVDRREADPKRGQMIQCRRGRSRPGTLEVWQAIHLLCPEAAGGGGKVSDLKVDGNRALKSTQTSGQGFQSNWLK